MKYRIEECDIKIFKDTGKTVDFDAHASDEEILLALRKTETLIGRTSDFSVDGDTRIIHIFQNGNRLSFFRLVAEETKGA